MISVVLMRINVIFFVIMLIVLKKSLDFKEKMTEIKLLKMRSEMRIQKKTKKV